MLLTVYFQIPMICKVVAWSGDKVSSSWPKLLIFHFKTSFYLAYIGTLFNFASFSKSVCCDRWDTIINNYLSYYKQTNLSSIPRTHVKLNILIVVAYVCNARASEREPDSKFWACYPASQAYLMSSRHWETLFPYNKMNSTWRMIIEVGVWSPLTYTYSNKHL